MPEIRDGDMALMGQRLDFLGINYYSRNLFNAQGQMEKVPGSEYTEMGWEVHGADNNMRADFFGPAGDTRWNQRRLEAKYPGFRHHELDDSTSLCGVLGHPLAGSLSPYLHNTAYARLGIKRCFLPFETEGVAEFLPLLEKLLMLFCELRTKGHEFALLLGKFRVGLTVLLRNLRPDFPA